jgi:hypothetical protein
MQEEGCSHFINIIFFTRIFFTEREEVFLKKILMNKQNKFSYYKIGKHKENEFFFDIYSCISQFMCKKFDDIDIYYLNKAFIAFSSILNINNLSEYIHKINMFEEDNQMNNPNRYNNGNVCKFCQGAGVGVGSATVPGTSQGFGIGANNPLSVNMNSNNKESVNQPSFIRINNIINPKLFEDIKNFKNFNSNK